MNLRIWIDQLQEAVESDALDRARTEFSEAVSELKHILLSEGLKADSTLITSIVEEGPDSAKVQACIAKCRQKTLFQKAAEKVQKFGRAIKDRAELAKERTKKRLGVLRNPDQFTRVQQQQGQQQQGQGRRRRRRRGNNNPQTGPSPQTAGNSPNQAKPNPPKTGSDASNPTNRQNKAFGGQVGATFMTRGRWRP
jgi:hypothetical protein